MKRLGFVGAGRMGLPMVRRLVTAGHEVRAHGRSEPTRRALGDAGAEACADLAVVADGADAVLICVHTDTQVRQVCLDSPLLDALPPDAVVVVHTTGGPHTVEAIAARGVRVVDAPVSGGPHDIAARRLTLFAGGEGDDVRQVRPVLAHYGDPVLHVGPLGSGQRVKLLNNALFAAQLGLLTQSVRVADAIGVGEAVLLDALSHGSAASRALAGAAARGSVAGFATSTREFLDKDIAAVRAVTGELGVELGALDDALEALGAPGAAPTARPGSTRETTPGRRQREGDTSGTS